jgi:uncharacterized membrane protein YuzA (DUF378 family)
MRGWRLVGAAAFAVAGAVYIVVGLAALWLERKASQAD